MSWGSETIRVYSKNQPVRVMFRAHLPCAFVRKFFQQNYQTRSKWKLAAAEWEG